MKYYVTYAIAARFVAEVEADNLELAKKEAQNQYWDADFGVAADIDGEQIIVEDENGNYIWEK